MMLSAAAGHVGSRSVSLALGLTCLVSAAAAVWLVSPATEAAARPPRTPSVLGERLFVSYPPTPTLEIDGVQHRLTRGTFSWDGMHFDAYGIMTTDEPVSADAPTTGTLRLGLAEPPQRLTLCVAPVGHWMAVAKGEGWAAWPRSSCRPRQLPPSTEQEIRLGLANGLYALGLHAI